MPHAGYLVRSCFSTSCPASRPGWGSWAAPALGEVQFHISSFLNMVFSADVISAPLALNNSFTHLIILNAFTDSLHRAQLRNSKVNTVIPTVCGCIRLEIRTKTANIPGGVRGSIGFYSAFILSLHVIPLACHLSLLSTTSHFWLVLDGWVLDCAPGHEHGSLIHLLIVPNITSGISPCHLNSQLECMLQAAFWSVLRWVASAIGDLVSATVGWITVCFAGLLWCETWLTLPSCRHLALLSCHLAGPAL